MSLLGPVHDDIQFLSGDEVKLQLEAKPIHGQPPFPRPTEGKHAFAIVGNSDCFDWHYRRSLYYFPDTVSESFGAALTASPEAYVVWSLSRNGHKKTLYVLHLEVTSSHQAQILLHVATEVAHRLGMDQIEYFLSNDAPCQLQYLIAGWRASERTDSLSSLMMWQDGKLIENTPRQVDWIGNEKYAWI
jgi:hypothetical protein